MFYLLFAAFLWGTSFIAGKIAYETADPALVVILRLIIASLTLLPLCIKRFKTVMPISKANLCWLAFLGVLTYPVTFALQFIGLSLTSASSAATMMGVEPIMVILMGWLVYRERTTLETVLIAGLAFIGVALVMSDPRDNQISILGCFLVLLSTVVVGYWLRLAKHFLQRTDPAFLTAFTMIMGTVLGSPLILLLVKNWHINFTVSGGLAILYLGIACSVMANWLWNKGLEKTMADVSGIFLALEPIFGVLMAVLLLGERLNTRAIIGVILVISSAAFVMCKPYFKKKANIK